MYQHTKLGQRFYNATIKAGIWLMLHPVITQILCLTWGLLGTLIGLLTALVALCIPGRKLCRFNGFIGIQFGKNWGGLEAIIFFLYAGHMGDQWTYHTKCHETGHAFQNAIWGPLFPFIVGIPSVVRYWIHRCGKTNVPYDAVWFEGSATDLGEMWADEWLSLDKASK